MGESFQGYTRFQDFKNFCTYIKYREKCLFTIWKPRFQDSWILELSPCNCSRYLHQNHLRITLYLFVVSHIYFVTIRYCHMCWQTRNCNSLRLNKKSVCLSVCPISTRDTAFSLRTDMGRGLIWGMVWKLPYHKLFIIHFSLWQVCLLDIVCGVKGKTAECSECGGDCFFARAKKPYPPPDLVIWDFCSGKKAVTHVTHRHTFCAPQEWYVLESHVSITYAKWTYFLVSVSTC